jgi:hypothetical protein
VPAGKAAFEGAHPEIRVDATRHLELTNPSAALAHRLDDQHDHDSGIASGRYRMSVACGGGNGAGVPNA